MASAISIAQTAAGTDYTKGGKTPKGFDCSGFVYFVLKQVFPDFSYLQAADMATSPLFVEVKAYRPGDLIFFPAGTDPYEIEKNSKSKIPSKLPAKVYGAHIGIDDYPVSSGISDKFFVCNGLGSEGSPQQALEQV